MSKVVMPTPCVSIGTSFQLNQLSPLARKRILRDVLRFSIKKTRKAVNSLREDGYISLEQMPNNKLMPSHKKGILEILNLVKESDEVEVVGFQPSGVGAEGSIVNQSYLNSREYSYSYYCFLMFRKRNAENKDVVYCHPKPLAHERVVKQAAEAIVTL